MILRRNIYKQYKMQQACNANIFSNAHTTKEDFEKKNNLNPI